MNPYAKFLGNLDPLEVIAATPARLSAYVQQIGPAGLDRSPAPGKWTTRSILCHLADVELVFAFRLRQALAEAHHVIQPFDQDVWAKPYSKLEPQAALAVFSTTRQWNLSLLETVDAETHGKLLTHPERGTMTFRNLIETMAGHDLNHLTQIAAIAALPS